MLTSLALSLLAGLVSVLSPCVLPLLPIVVGGALHQHRLAPVALAAGLAVSFTLLGMMAAALGLASGIDAALIRTGAALIMTIFGLILLCPVCQRLTTRLLSPLAAGSNIVLAGLDGRGLWGQALLGMVLGAAWSPCAGPSLGAAIGLAAQSGTVYQAALIMALFSVGATVPLMALAYGSRQGLPRRRDRLAKLSHWAKPAMGGTVLAVGLSILSGLDKVLESWATSSMPAWLVDLTTRF